MLKKFVLGLIILVIVAISGLFLSLGAPYDSEASEYYQMSHPENINRTISNSLAKNETTFLKFSEETGGEYTLLEVTLEPGGSNENHYHNKFTEEFTAVEGTLGVRVDDERIYLEPGETHLVERGSVHGFFNDTDEEITFQVKIEPGSQGFEKALYILYGLVNDGLVDENGIPTDPEHTAIFVVYSDTHAPGILGLASPLFRRLAGSAQRTGTEAELVERYFLSHTE